MENHIGGLNMTEQIILIDLIRDLYTIIEGMEKRLYVVEQKAEVYDKLITNMSSTMGGKICQQ